MNEARFHTGSTFKMTKVQCAGEYNPPRLTRAWTLALREIGAADWAKVVAQSAFPLKSFD